MYKLLITLSVFLLIAAGCKKEAGEGGNSTIAGKITIHDYKGSFPFFYESYPGQEDDVYIIYGDATSGYDNRTRTSYDGTFRFDYLRKGDYKVFVYSDDTTNIFSNTKQIIMHEVSIGKNKSTVEVPEFVVIKL